MYDSLVPLIAVIGEALPYSFVVITGCALLCALLSKESHPAGCSVQEELFMSFEQMLAVSDRSKIPFDRIVLENSGVAEPQNIREAFAQAMEVGHPVVSRVHLSTMVRLHRVPLTAKLLCIPLQASHLPSNTVPALQYALIPSSTQLIHECHSNRWRRLS